MGGACARRSAVFAVGGAGINLELRVRRGNEFVAQVDDLGFAEAHPRFWNALPADADLYGEPDFSGSLRRAKADAHEAVWRAATTPRFELAGGATDAEVFLPLGMATLPKFFLTAEHSARTPLERDALDRFEPELFLDREMIKPTAQTLLAQADFIRYQSSSPRRLLGIHAAMQDRRSDADSRAGRRSSGLGASDRRGGRKPAGILTA